MALLSVTAASSVCRNVAAASFPSSQYNYSDATNHRIICSTFSLRHALLNVRPSTRVVTAVDRPSLTPLSSKRTESARKTRPARFVTCASAETAGTVPPAEKPVRNPFLLILSAIKSVWRQIVQPLGNFGFGKRSIWEGGVGLFLLTGVFMLALAISWIKGVQVRAGTTKYQAIVEFDQACGITVGTPVRIRGVDVGNVVGVKPSLERIDVVVEVMDAGVIIPRNALVEVNQSGLISETLIDITPRHPIPKPTVGPLSSSCDTEGLIVCDRQRIVGQQGVSLDELVGICTKLAKQMDKEGLDKVFDAVNKVSLLMEDVKPILEKVNRIAGDLAPLMKDVNEGELLSDLEGLTKVATEAVQDLRTLNNSVLSIENTDLLRQSVATLTKTLEHIESISADVSSLTGDSGTKNNLRQLIESLSRLVNN